MKSELWFREKGKDIPYNHSIIHFLSAFLKIQMVAKSS